MRGVRTQRRTCYATTVAIHPVPTLPAQRCAPPCSCLTTRPPTACTEASTDTRIKQLQLLPGSQGFEVRGVGPGACSPAFTCSQAPLRPCFPATCICRPMLPSPLLLPTCAQFVDYHVHGSEKKWVGWGEAGWGGAGGLGMLLHCTLACSGTVAVCHPRMGALPQTPTLLPASPQVQAGLGG